MKNQYIGGDCLQKGGLGQFADLREGLGEKEGVVFFFLGGGGGIDTPMHSMEVKASPYYSTFFDETLNKVTQQEQMDIYVTFWNLGRKRIESRYFETDMGHMRPTPPLTPFKVT